MQHHQQVKSLILLSTNALKCTNMGRERRGGTRQTHAHRKSLCEVMYCSFNTRTSCKATMTKVHRKTWGWVPTHSCSALTPEYQPTAARWEAPRELLILAGL